MRTITLYRPVGRIERQLIEESGWRRFPPRLPSQPIFYPVLTESYAVEIARDWNAKDASSASAGYVTRFEVGADFLERYEVHTVGSSRHKGLATRRRLRISRREATMSMIAVLQQLDEVTIRRLLEDPGQVTEVIEASTEADRIDLDKAWHGLHFLFTGTAWEGEPPLSLLLVGGEQVGDVDVGYGPASLLRSPAVRAFAQALASLDEATLRARFDPARMTELDIYPTIWDRPAEEDDTLGYLLAYFGTLREFVAKASAAGRGLLVYLC